VLALAAAYQLTALIASVRHVLRRDRVPQALPPVSILKPLRGADPDMYEAFRSHAAIDYPDFELLFGLADPADPSAALVRRLAAEFPDRNIHLVVADQRAPNGKVGVLASLAARARHSLLLVNDSDIRVPPEYLHRLVAPLEDLRCGLVTCLYRARGESFAARMEALGIATDFVPSTLVAPLVGVREFALGSTMLFRRADLDSIGGFQSIGDYLADDYQLGRRITALGKYAALARMSVETRLSAESWRDVWQHQLRWARTIRVSRGSLLGYLGLPVTFATLWAALAVLAGWYLPAAILIALRLAASAAGALAVSSRASLALLPLVPLRDLFGTAIWIAGLWGRRVIWRDQTLTLDRFGRIVQSNLEP
jgi:ceramide glucosyltransferase